MKKFQEFFYVHKAGGWYDYNMRDKAHNFEFFPSIAIPLFTGCYDDLDLEQSARIFDKMETMGVFDHAGGIPTRFYFIISANIFEGYKCVTVPRIFYSADFSQKITFSECSVNFSRKNTAGRN